jgi:multidrug efflux pump subunit AcrB
MQPEQLAEIVIKADGEVSVTRLRDVASSLELGAGHGGFASLDGKPTAVLAVYPLVRWSQSEVSADVRARLSELRRRFPEGLDAFTGFDFSGEPKSEASGYLVLDVDPPVGASVEMTGRLLVRGDQSLRRLAGVKSVLALSEQPFDHDSDQPCLVVCLGQSNCAPVDRERLIREIRREMHPSLVVAGQAASIRVRDLSGTARSRRFGYPIDFAICGPERPRVQELAGQLVARMSVDPGLTDVWADLRTAPSLELSHLDRIGFLPAVSITATPAGGLTEAAARSVCERLAAEILPKRQPTEYRLVWLRASAR